ncbi:breast cancer type 2 susceptibility protein isoform X2 [Anas platyrhynchos]|uniref:breast cancer type 2 susceptibility protein isoform X2 n=1 Tax=Anas platyrhynchos TaxID=8839 RepID=UPI003AF30E0C
MACRSGERPTFFEIFKTRCSDSDLGPISLNWFEELSSEAPPYEPKLLELDAPIDQTSFKTPKAKPFTYSQLTSTPPIFKEQNTIMPPFSSPGIELDQKKIGTSRENFTSPSIIGRKRDQENEMLASPLGTCHNFLAASPAILRNAFRTPQRSNIPGPYGSLFCTPKFLEVRTPKRISESLGAEVDPDMSWSSSLATPPTLGATVIIARETSSISGPKQQDERAEIVLHSFSSDHDECPGKNDSSLLSIPETVKLNGEDVTKEFESEMLDGFFGEMDSFENTLTVPAESSGTLLLLPHALDAIDKCETKRDEAQGEEDVPSEQPVRRKTGISQEVEMGNGAEKSHPIEMKDYLSQNADEDTGDSKDACLIGHEKELDLLRITGNMQDNGMEKSCENEKLVKDDVLSSSSQWSQLNLSGLDVTHLEMSTCSSPSIDLCTDKDLKEKTALMAKDDAVGTSLLNTLGLKNAQQLLNASLSDMHEEMQKTGNNPTAEVTPVRSVHLNPELVKGHAAEKVSKMSFINCNSFLIKSTNVMEYSVVYNSSFSKCVKATSKSVVTDVLSHPLVCSTSSPDNCSDLHFTSSENTLTKSGFKSLNMLSRLKNKSKRFIYTINNTLLYQEEKIQKEVTSELPADLMLPQLETDSHEFQGCHVAADGDPDSLLSAERQLNIKEDNLSTCVKKDLEDNSSFDSRLKQQELRNLGKDTREYQPATSLKCLEVSNHQKEDTTDSLNSERISNIKRKVLSASCLMARKRSRLFPEDCCLEKGEEDTSMSHNVNNGATVPQSLKRQPAQAFPSNNDCLLDVCHDITSVTNRDVNKTLSQINFDINRVSSDSCSKISADEKHATDPLALVEHRQVLAPVGMNCSGDDRIRLKQCGKKDVAAFSGDVADNQETRLVKSDESPEAAACNKVAVEIVEELLDCIDDNSLIEVISEEDKQVPPIYSHKEPNENLEHEGKSSGIVNVCRSNLSFGGFQTASNKQIKFSEDSIAKGKMLFKDIENECFEASYVERGRNFSNQVQKENVFSSNLESKLGSALSGSQTRRTQFTPHKVDLCKNFPRSLHSLQELNQTLTASQEAEIAEISSILEETGSQFEFTQFRRQSNMVQSVEKQDIVTVEMHGAANVENNSEPWKDTDPCSTFKSENQVRNDKYCSTWKDTDEECKMVEYEKENKVLFHKSSEEVTFSDRDESGVSDGESFPVPVQASVSNFVGFTSAGGKKINISKAALTRSAELFKDLDDNYLLKSSETNTGCGNSKGSRGMSSNWNSFRCLTKENKGVSNINSVGAISHAHSISHHSENVGTPEKENKENWTERLISDDERVDFSHANARHSAYGMRNSPTSIQEQNQNHKIPKQVLNPGDCQAEDSLQEDSLYVTCLGDATATAEHCDLSISDEMENLFPAEKGEDSRQKDEHLPQKFQTSDGAISVSGGPLDNSLHGLSVNCGERDVDVSENSDKQKTTGINIEGEDTTDESLFVNESRIKMGSYQHHQVPFEQEVDVEPSEVKGSFLTGFQTASGKKITIADGFLAKAEQFFSEEDVDLGKEHNDNFEDHIKNRKRSVNCVKGCDLRIDNVAQCDAEKLISEEPGIRFKQTRGSSPTKQAVILDSVKVDAFANIGEDSDRNLVAAYEKADVQHGKSELESLSEWESKALSRTCLSEDGKLFAEMDVECSAKKKDKSESTHGFPVQSAISLPSMKVSSNPVDNSMPCDVKNTLFVEDSSKSDQSVLKAYSSVSQSHCPQLNSDSKEFDVQHLNQPCSNTSCFADAALTAHQKQSEVGLPEGGTNLACLQETSLNFNDGNPKGGLKQTVFSTAKGKAVFVSESALARVRQMFQEDYGESVKHEIKTKSRTNQTEIPVNSSFVVPAECPNSTKFLDATKREGNSAASHFTDGNVNASEDSQQDANPFEDEISVPNSQVQGFGQNTALLGHVPVPNKQMKQSDSSTSNLGFFSTASGKPVQLSEESLKKARQLFSEMESSHSSGLQEFQVEGDVEKSEKLAEEVFPRKMQLEERENASTKMISGPAFGFSTASGKQVTVSENAYQKAKAILKESDDFLSNELCIIDQLHAIKESGHRTKSRTGNVISESKTDKSCDELDFKSIHPEEMKSSSSTHHLKMPEYVPHSKKNSQLALVKNSFKQEETGPVRKGLNLGMKTESEAVSCSATAKAEINDELFQTPKSHFKVGTVGNEKASVGDHLSDPGAKTNSAQSFCGKTSDKSFQNKTFGKRHFEEKNALGEPPIKRQLLLEFDKTKMPPRSLKASKSTPEGIFKDRRKFLYHVPLKPVTCQPFGASKERQEVRNPTLTLPDQDFKGFKSKPAIFQHCALRQSSNDASRLSTPHKASAQESEEKRNLNKSGKTAKTFVPPFKTKLTFSTSEQGSSKRCDSPISKNMTEEREINQIRIEKDTAETRDHPSCILHAADTDLENVMNKMMANLRCARDLQEMRIKKKFRQNISSQPGSLYVIKTSARNRISLKTAVEEKSPSFYSTEELYRYGVSKHCVQVNSTNAESFQFLIKDFFSKEYLLAGNGIQLADGGWLIPTDEGKAGKKEFYRALCDTPGVDPKLITEAWVYNHYRWIVWKLAAMEVAFPHEFATRCLTPETVLLQLKYRYDLEIDKSKRSAIKKITERDDAAGKTLVLCVSKIISLNAVVSPSNNNMESKKGAAIIEVTDGWYGIRALLDPPIKAFLHRRRLTVGQKIIVHGAELVGSQNGCTPLEAPDSLMLKISANSTRCARWHAKLGFHRDPRPFPLPLSSLYSEGGAVGCIDVVIQRAYPIQWMEKTSAGSYVFRNSRAEEREAVRHAEDQQKKLEALFAKIQAEFEKHEERASRKTPSSRVVTRQQIHNLQDGAELYEAIQNASDPGYMEGYLSEDQLKALNAHRQLMNDKKQTRIQEEFKKAVESAEKEKYGCSKRDVSTVWKLCVVDYRKQEKHKGVILSIWRPPLDVCSLLKEGSRYRIYQLSASQSKGRAESTNIQLTATKKTQYLQLSVSKKMLLQIFFPRKALKFTSLLDPSFQPPCAEVDLVGVVISVSKTGFATMVYLSDESYNLVAIKVWADLRHFAIEDIVVRSSFISASNLQWQSDFRSEIPMLVAGDLSVFSASPKETYLQEKFNELRSLVENVDSFCSDAESKLMNLLQRSQSLTPTLPKRCGSECFSPSCNSGLYAADKSLISSSKMEIKYLSPLSTSTPNMKLVPQGSAKTPSFDEDHPKNSKKRKAMDFLSCIPAPPPLTPICSTISPSLKKAFQPPRSLGLQRNKLGKETNPNVGFVTPSRKVREAVRVPVNDLVADEELAMINTQALINTLPEEKKTEGVNETSTIATNLSDDLSSKRSSRSTEEAKNSLKSSSEGAEALQEDTKELGGSLSTHRMLQRRKSRKCY